MPYSSKKNEKKTKADNRLQVIDIESEYEEVKSESFLSEMSFRNVI